jgi:hypothetical protein
MAPMRVKPIRMEEALWQRARRTLKCEHRRSLAELIRQALALGLDEIDRRRETAERAALATADARLQRGRE